MEKKTIKKYRNNLLRNNLSSYKKIFRYLYFKVFSEIYCSTRRHGLHLKSNFHIIFKTYKDKKAWKFPLGKTLRTIRQLETRPLFLNRNLSTKLMILMRSGKKRSKNELKNENKNDVR